MTAKHLVFPVLFLLLVSLVSAAPSFPVPISGTATLNGIPLPNVDIEMKNIQTGHVELTRTDNFGYFRVDWGGKPWYSNSIVQIKIVQCAQAECTTSVVMTGDPIRGVTFPLQGVYPEIQIKFQCWDGSFVDGQSLCPVQPIPPAPEPEIREQIVCQDGTAVDNLEDCPTDATKAILGILATLLGIATLVLSKFRWGKGFVGLANYWKKKGDEEMKKRNYALAEKYYKRAASMLSSAMQKQKDNLLNK